jgi:WD40 repeat protein
MSVAPLERDDGDRDPISGHDVDISVFAHLGFGRGGHDAVKDTMCGRHLALLPADTLELDLSDPAQRQFGEYELLEQIGEGGMGVVYRARQISLDREVAVKLLAAGVWASKEFVERFRREAQNAARMQHPNIVPVYEVGENDELHFFSMGLIRGGSLSAELKRDRKIAPLRAAQLLRTIAEAVDYAHRIGVLHLDLKPANVLIDENGVPHVADFGLARRLDSALAGSTDEISGTPSYMAPEQASPRTQRITTATDIWGLGAILYELTTGEPPFLGKSPQATLKLVVEEGLVNPRRHAPELSRDLEAVILKCMTYRVDERYPSARALAEDLTRYIEGRAVRARPLSAAQRFVRWAKREPKLATTALIAVAAIVIGLVATQQQWRRAESSVAETSATLWQARRAAAEVAIRADDGFSAMLPILTNVTEKERQGADASGDRMQIGLLLDNAPRLIDVLPLDGIAHDLDVSPDRRQVAVLTEKWSVSLIDAVRPSILWTTPIAPSEALRFSTDGQALHVLADQQGQEHWHWERLRIDDGVPIVPAVPGKWTQNSYSLDNHFALLGDDHDRVQLWDLRTGKALSELHELPRGSADLFADGSIFWGGKDNGSEKRLTVPGWKSAWEYEQPAGEITHYSDWSADRRWSAIGMDSGRLDLLDLTHGTTRTLPDSFGNRIGHLVFSPDGEWIAAGSRDRRTKIWSTATGASLSLPIEHAGMVTTLAVDDKARLLMSNDDGTLRVWRLAEAPSRYAPAVPVGPRLLAHGSAFNIQPMLLLPERNIAMTGGDTNDLYIWRLPANPMRHAHAAPVADSDLNFDGQHLVNVDGNQVTVLDAWTENNASPSLNHEQPVSHAALSRNAATLWVAAGDEVHRWDWQHERARAAPVRLTNVVQRMAVNPRRDEVIVSVLSYDAGRVYEQLSRIDATDGKVLATTRLAGPLTNIRYSDDGARLLAWRGKALMQFDATTLVATGSVLRMDANDKSRYASYTDVRATEKTLWTTVFTDAEPREELWRYDASATTPTWRGSSFSSGLIAVVSRDGSQAVISPGGYPGHVPLQRFDASGAHVLLGDRGYGGMAADFSPDGRWLATALPDGIRLYSSDANPVGPPLRAALDFHDRIEQVAYATDGASVLARSVKGHWLLWRVRPDERPVATIADELNTSLATAGDGQRPLHVDAALRSRLRARDPGEPAAPAAPRPDPNLTPPERASDTPATLLDLSATITRTAHEWNTEDSSFDLRRLALGRQRIDGFDFDLRGVVHLSTPQHSPTPVPPPQEIRGIAVPAKVLAFQVLMGDVVGDNRPSPFLSVILHFADGGERRVPITLSIPWITPPSIVDPLKGEETGAPLVMQVRDTDAEYTGAEPLRLYRMRVENPEPNRALKSIGLRAERREPYVAAITAEVPNEQ